jgi:hypothetical protein
MDPLPICLLDPDPHSEWDPDPTADEISSKSKKFILFRVI